MQNTNIAMKPALQKVFFSKNLGTFIKNVQAVRFNNMIQNRVENIFRYIIKFKM